MEHQCRGSQTNPQVMASIQLSSSTWQQNVTTDDSGTSERERTEKDWSKCNKNIKQNSWLEARHASLSARYSIPVERRPKLTECKTKKDNTRERASKRTRDNWSWVKISCTSTQCTRRTGVCQRCENCWMMEGYTWCRVRCVTGVWRQLVMATSRDLCVERRDERQAAQGWQHWWQENTLEKIVEYG